MNSSSKKTEKELETAAEIPSNAMKNVDLLELTLGFGSASSNAAMHGLRSFRLDSDQPSHPSKQSQEIPLGLKHHQVDPSGNIHGLWWGHHQSLSNYLPFSSSLISLPSNFPNASHHCSERPNPGLWFSLRSIINRDGEVLPQIPKAYIRVKNQNVTVFMVKTYLVRKLGLSNEAQVDISCMGQKLLHSHNLKNVRDEIWLPKVIEFFNSNPTLVQDSHSITTLHHLMSLDYGKCCLFN